MSIKKVFIAGSGLMGGGIAQVCAQSGLKVWLWDISKEATARALKNIEWSAGKLIEKGKAQGPLESVMERIAIADSHESAAEADLIIEAVFEKLDVKQDALRLIDTVAASESLIATNTSAISISELANSVTRPERFVGIHFFSPVPMMQAVEVIRGMLTNDETFEAGRDFVHSIGKEPIMVHKDVPGFLINRINFPATLQAIRLVEAGVGTVEDIDKGLRLASGRKMGIFETGDMVGLDVTYGALTAIYEETRDPFWYPPMTLRRKVKAGHLGRKTGKGWYEYNPDGTRKEPDK